MGELDIVVIAEHADDFGGFVFAHQAVIDKDAVELIANGFL